MSSFQIGPSNQPMVTGSQNLGKDGGGGGNTGFMNMRKRKRGSRQNEEDESVFLEEIPPDSFEKSDKKKDKKNNKILGAISNFIKDKVPKDPNSKDTFTKNDDIEEETEENENEYSSYNVPLNKPVDPIEDDEYEIADDDDYYNNVDV
ncbi:MAG: hypothetical protein LUE64_07145 [Candidatus Gastranaerophilales bacterium]|nr:hypothetical protein [Candidatus Gastranaerophilales bacterium]